MSDPPKRHSTEPTLVIDVEKALDDKARAAIARAADSYPELPDDVLLSDLGPEDAAAVLRAQRRNAVTQVPCPACSSCLGCGGQHMVTVERAAEIRAAKAEGSKPR